MYRTLHLNIKLSRYFCTTVENTANKTTTNFIENVSVDTKLLKVAIVGSPNAGKSSLINQLMDRKVCPTSSKVHTTRHKALAIFTAEDTQIVFVDTPGLVNDKQKRRYNLERSFIKDSQSSSVEADVIGVVHDASNVHTRECLDIKAIKLLESNSSKPSFLILNKVDILRSKRKLLDITRLLTENCIGGKPFSERIRRSQQEETRGWPLFTDVFMVSALTGNGLDRLKQYLIDLAKPGKWLFPDKIWSDQSVEKIITESVWAKLLDFLPQEIPYTLKAEMEYFDINESGVITTVVLVHCPSERVAKLIAGAADGRLKQINESLQNDLQNTFHNYVRIRIVLKSPQK